MDYLRKVKLLNRKKSDPDKFIFTGTYTVDHPDIQLFKYNKDNCIENKDMAVSDIENFDSNGYCNWLNIYGLNDSDAIASICRKQGVDSLVIQDILDINQRPKFQEFDTYSFLTIKSTLPSDADMIVEQISFVFGKNFLISFQERKADYFDHLRFRLREYKGIIRDRGSDYLLYAMLEAILDNYFKTLEIIDSEADKLNLANINEDPDPSILEKIEKHKKFVYFIKKAIHPIKEFIAIIERETSQYIEGRNLNYFLEIKDLCLTLIDRCDTIISSLESSANLFFSVQGHRMNQVMKTLTVVATIFIPLTFIAGIYGMNFTNMPELQWKYGYAAIWVVILIVLISMIIYFKRKKWF